MRKYITYPIPDPEAFKERLLHWGAQQEYFCFYNSNGPGEYELLAAAGNEGHVSSFEALDKSNDWFFGFLSYDLKNKIEELHSCNHDGLSFPELLFFQPRYVFELRGKELRIGSLNEGLTPDSINVQRPTSNVQRPIEVQQRSSRTDYLTKVNHILNHIKRGDIYEMNFCQEFFAENAQIDPVQIFKRLNEISHSPFSAFCRFGDKYLLSSSPERYLRKKGNKVLSQPIKGTRKRGSSDQEDKQLQKELALDEKERSENVMIVDLVRNDLSRVAKAGSVKVEELFGVYSFQQVHQMISTVSCELELGRRLSDIIKASFPMGSMTGAPKVRAMQLIEEYETTKRGLYSGAVGYITPNGDADLSVVIRSILYNASAKYLSFMAGSAITAGSRPEQEYEECLLKAKAMFQVLGND